MDKVMQCSILLSTLVMTGCASLTGSKNQAISVQTHMQGDAVEGAKCVLMNDKGSWFVTTPGSVMVQKSYEDLSVNCNKPAVSSGLAYFRSKSNGGVWGNILAGGIIGYAIDSSNGSGFDYPPLLTVEMGVTQSPLTKETTVNNGSSMMGGAK